MDKRNAVKPALTPQRPRHTLSAGRTFERIPVTEMEKFAAPFTAEQVEALNKWQKWGANVGFHCSTHDKKKLEARTDGWHCTEPGCTHALDWAYAFMTKAFYCTAESPYMKRPGDDKEYWIHVDAKEADLEYDGELVPYRCPNCGHEYSVDNS